MKTLILLIALVLCNLSFSCEILPNGKYIPCDIKEQIFEAESRLNEAEVKYVESIKKYKTTPYNADSGISKRIAHSEMRIAEFEYETARSECGRIYAIAKGEPTSLPVGKSPSEIFKLVK